VFVTVAVRNAIVSTVKRCVPMHRALLKPGVQNTACSALSVLRRKYFAFPSVT
jgi:hypothetical protein